MLSERIDPVLVAAGLTVLIPWQGEGDYSDGLITDWADETQWLFLAVLI